MSGRGRDEHGRGGGAPAGARDLSGSIGSAPTVVPGPTAESHGSGGPPEERGDDDAGGPPAIEPGAAIDRYVVSGELGSGGMGVVLRAFDPELERPVAVKLLRRADTSDAAARARLVRESKAIAQLAHPNIVAVYDVGTHEEEPFIAMELVDGAPLDRWLSAGRRPLDEILGLFVQAGRGLAAAHDKGIIHRDFKPSNMLVGTDGRVRVVDFGLARAGEVPTTPSAERADDGELHSSLTRPGAILGTPAYMAPEQHQGRLADERSDQFAFCAALYEALYDQKPFAGETYAEIRRSALAGSRVEPPKDPRVAPWLRQLLQRGLAADPADRYPSMAALVDALERGPVSARRKRLLAMGALLLGGALASMLVAELLTSGAEATPAGSAPAHPAAAGAGGHGWPWERFVDAFAGGFYLFVGVYHFQMYRRRPQLRAYLWFSLLCLCALGVDLTGLLLYQSSSPTLSALNWVCAALTVSFLIEFIWSLGGHPPSSIRVAQVALPPVALLASWLPRLVGPALLLGGVGLVAALGRIVVDAWRGHREARTLAIGAVALIVAILADVFLKEVLHWVPHSLPVVVPGFIALFLSMAASLANRFEQTHRELDDIRRSAPARATPAPVVPDAPARASRPAGKTRPTIRD